MENRYYVYIMSSATDVTVYIGVTNDLVRRVWEHKAGVYPESFTAKYNVHKLVYYEVTNDVNVAIAREKQLKSWNRARKNTIITAFNPKWEDLYESILG